jgi:flagellar basal-body rod protein FlgG
MLRVLWNGKSAMIANQDKLDSISNNMSNVSTDGYKRIDVSFKDLVYETLDRNGYPNTANEGKQDQAFTGSGVRTSGWIRDTKQGDLVETKKTTDFAIDGSGYFKLNTPSGQTAYTRSGKFDVDASGNMVDPNGNILSINFKDGYSAENVKFTKDNFSVKDDGTLVINSGNVIGEVGKIQLYNTMGSSSMKSVGENLYVPENGVEVNEVTNADILQGFKEGSNVDIVREMTEMLITQRAFELGSRSIKTADEMWGMANNLRGR